MQFLRDDETETAPLGSEAESRWKELLVLAIFFEFFEVFLNSTNVEIFSKKRLNYTICIAWGGGGALFLKDAYCRTMYC